jgi:hypothetical protein
MNQQTKAYLYALVVVLIWSTVASAFKITLRFIDYQNLVFYSVSVSLLTLLAILIVQKKQVLLVHCTLRDYSHSALLGFLNPFLVQSVLTPSRPGSATSKSNVGNHHRNIFNCYSTPEDISKEHRRNFY